MTTQGSPVHAPFGAFSRQPNVVLLITDQQRRLRGFPPSFTNATYLPALTWLTEQGLTFSRATIAASPCGPSRGVLMTGLYPQLTGVWGNGDTLPAVGTALPADAPASETFRLETLGSVAEKAGYDVTYLGKWHLDGSFVEVLGIYPAVISQTQDLAMGPTRAVVQLFGVGGGALQVPGLGPLTITPVSAPG
jgi:arylsulfatase A-like enzyme